MRKLRDVLRYLHSAGLSPESIDRALRISKGVVARYLRLASTAGLTWAIPEALADSVLEKLLSRQGNAREPTFAEPDYALVNQELKRKGVTLTLLWGEYRQAVGERSYQYTAFCTRYRDRSGKLKRSMRQIHRAGEKLFADYAGPTVHIVDARTGEIRPASIFVAVLRLQLHLCLRHAGANPNRLPDWHESGADLHRRRACLARPRQSPQL